MIGDLQDDEYSGLGAHRISTTRIASLVASTIQKRSFQRSSQALNYKELP